MGPTYLSYISSILWVLVGTPKVSQCVGKLLSHSSKASDREQFWELESGENKPGRSNLPFQECCVRAAGSVVIILSLPALQLKVWL